MVGFKRPDSTCHVTSASIILKLPFSGLKPHSSLTDGWRKWAVRGVSWLDAEVYADWRSRKMELIVSNRTGMEVAARGIR